MRDKESEREAETQREKEALCKEPDVGLDPGCPRSWAEGGTKPLRHPGCPQIDLF